MPAPSFKRVVLKLSGEVLGKGGIDLTQLSDFVQELKSAYQTGCELILVLGGGNLFRGRSLKSFPPVNADYLGMTATILNGLTLAEVLRENQVPCKLFSALEVEQAAEKYDRLKALNYLKEKNLLILVGGLGLPFFTTDTAAALRARELNADLLLKATKVQGVYSAEPEKHPNAQFFNEISYTQVLQLKIEVMDLTAILLCQRGNLPVRVFNFQEKGNLLKILAGENIGSLIRGF